MVKCHCGISIAIAFIIVSLVLIRRNKNYAFPIAIAYLIAIVYLAFLAREPMPLYHYSLNPFAAARKGIEFGGGIITGFLSGDVKITNRAILEGIVLNILFFIPFGFLIPIIWKKRWTWWKVMIVGLPASFCIEIIQLVTRLGFADVDDLINNTIGSGLGHLLYKGCLTHVVNQSSEYRERKINRPHEDTNYRSGRSIRP